MLFWTFPLHEHEILIVMSYSGLKNPAPCMQREARSLGIHFYTERRERSESRLCLCLCPVQIQKRAGSWTLYCLFLSHQLARGVSGGVEWGEGEWRNREKVYFCEGMG